MGAVRPDDAGDRGGVSGESGAGVAVVRLSLRHGRACAAQSRPPRIAELERWLPQVVVVTQNIDGLHQAAGFTDVVELHGSIRSFKCLTGRHTGFIRADFADQAEIPPRCPHCGDLLRPDVVWFGELLPGEAINRAYDLADACDAMLVVGTSGVVQPAASLPFIARHAGAPVIDVNPERDEIADAADFFLEGRGGEILPRLLAELRAHHKR